MEVTTEPSNPWRVHVSGFPSYTQPQDLTRVFSSYGTLKVVKMTAKFAILSFDTDDDAKEAIEDTNKVNIYGEFLTVKPYSEEHTKSGFRQKQQMKNNQNVEVPEPKLLDLSGDFHEQLDRVLSAVRLTQEEVNAISGLYEDLEWVLNQRWPGCVAMPFGSITTGLGVKGSDADCFINLPPAFRVHNDNLISKAKKLLQQHPWLFADIVSIPRANTPIVKFLHVPTLTRCDVSFKTPLGARNSRLLAFLLHADPRLLPLAVLAKYWARVHGLSGTGRLTNYALALMLLFYLQQAPCSLLPSVVWLQRDPAHELLVDGWNTGFEPDHERLPRPADRTPISELLGGFFQYYAGFDFGEQVVCPFLGLPLKKEAFKNADLLPPEFARYRENVEQYSVHPIRVGTPICVQDPIELSHNVASAITGRLAQEIKAFFELAAAAYEAEKSRGCEKFLSTILLQKPKLPRGKSSPEYRFGLYPHVLHCIADPDWKSVVREVLMQLFSICKIELTRLEDEPNAETNVESKRKEKERYSGTLTKTVWKRKQFGRLYSQMQLDFVEKQNRITEEVLNTCKESFEVEFRLQLTFNSDTRYAGAAVKLAEGDPMIFREFGKFFISVLQNWFFVLLRPRLIPRDALDPKSSAANSSATQKTCDNNVNNGEVHSDKVEAPAESAGGDET